MVYLASQTKNLEFEKDVQIDNVLPDLSGANKEQVLHNIAAESAKFLQLKAESIYFKLKMQDHKEGLAIGGGVAIPTIEVADLEKTTVIFARLENALDFKADDQKPVDLICLICTPSLKNPYYLRKLSRLTRLFKNKELCEKIRATNDYGAIPNIIHNPTGWMMAA